MNDTMRRDAISRVGITIAIDGPAGSGKSTVSKALATRLGIGYLDTGAMYRALTWYCLDEGIDLEDTAAVAAAADRMPLRLVSDPSDPHVWIGDREITLEIREPRIALAIKHISTNLDVRAWMATEQRRRMMEAREEGSGMIAEGRDITTVVCPDADVRVLLLADQEARLRRRTLELYGDATEEHMEIVRAQVEGRDKADSQVSEFMVAAPGVETVDSTGLDIEGVCEAVLVFVDRDLEARRVALRVRNSTRECPAPFGAGHSRLHGVSIRSRRAPVRPARRWKDSRPAGYRTFLCRTPGIRAAAYPPAGSSRCRRCWA